MSEFRTTARVPLALRKGAMTAVRAVLLAVALAVSALGIPLPVRLTPATQGRRDTEAVRDADGTTRAG